MSQDGVATHLGPLLAWVTGAKSLTHALATIKAEPPSVLPPNRQWLLIETVDGYKAAVRTGTQIERLREMLGMAGVRMAPGEYGLRNQATKMLERPRPPRKDL